MQSSLGKEGRREKKKRRKRKMAVPWLTLLLFEGVRGCARVAVVVGECRCYRCGSRPRGWAIWWDDTQGGGVLVC